MKKTQVQRLKKFLFLAWFCLMINWAVAADWSNTNLSSGTYRLTTTTGNAFKVVQTDVTPNVTIGTFDNIGDIRVTLGSVTIEFANTATIYLNTQISVTGGTLNLNKTAAGSGVTLQRSDTNQNICIRVANAYSDVNQCVLNINGYSDSDHFVLDGGCGTLTISPGGNFYTASCTGVQTNSQLIYTYGGTFTTNNVDIQNNWANQTESDRSRGSAIMIGGNVFAKSENIVHINNTNIRNCYSYANGAGLTINCGFKGAVSRIEMNNSSIRNCFTDNNLDSAGTVRTWAGSNSSLFMEDCTIESNYCWGAGGGIYWSAVDVDPLRLSNCIISNNKTFRQGGGINVTGALEVEKCH